MYRTEGWKHESRKHESWKRKAWNLKAWRLTMYNVCWANFLNAVRTSYVLIGKGENMTSERWMTIMITEVNLREHFLFDFEAYRPTIDELVHLGLRNGFWNGLQFGNSIFIRLSVCFSTQHLKPWFSKLDSWKQSKVFFPNLFVECYLSFIISKA